MKLLSIRQTSLHLGVGFLLMLLLVSSVHSATISWLSTTTGGNWTDSTSWSSSSTPKATDTVYFATDTSSSTFGSTLLIDSGVSAVAGSLNVGSSATANYAGTVHIVSGATLNMAGALALGTNAAGTGCFIQDGGTVTASKLITGASSSLRSGYYYMNGGTLNLTASSGAISLANKGNGYFYQTGGTVKLSSDLSLVPASPSAGTNTALYSISGGTLAVTGNINNATAATVAYLNSSTFQVIGSKATINVTGNYAQLSSTKAILNYQIDNGGVSKINLTGTGTASMAGALSAGIKGGIALTSTTSFSLIEANTGNITGSYLSTPNSTLWSTPAVQAVSSTRDALVLSLNASANKGSLTDATILNSLTFTSSSAGDVTINDVGVGEGLVLYLKGSAGTSKTISDLIAYFTGNGLIAVASDLDAYDIKVTYSASDIASGTDNFIWDLSSFNSTATLDSIGAVALVPEPTVWALVIMGVAALLVQFRVRRRED
jgi:hypothetical protein